MDIRVLPNLMFSTCFTLPRIQVTQLVVCIYAFFRALRLCAHREKKTRERKKHRDADRAFELSKSCANKRHIASMRMFAQTFLPIDAQFSRQN